MTCRSEILLLAFSDWCISIQWWVLPYKCNFVHYKDIRRSWRLSNKTGSYPQFIFAIRFYEDFQFSSKIWDNPGLIHVSAFSISDYREAFLVFDKDGDGTVTVSEIGLVMKSLGQNPSEAEIKSMVQEVDTKGSSFLWPISNTLSLQSIDLLHHYLLFMTRTKQHPSSCSLNDLNTANTQILNDFSVTGSC